MFARYAGAIEQYSRAAAGEQPTLRYAERPLRVESALADIRGVTPGASIDLAVEFNRQPSAAPEWRKDGKALSVDGRKISTSAVDARRFVLHVERVSSTDAGEYTLLLPGAEVVDASATSCSAQVTVKHVPSEPQQLAVAATGADWLRVQWRAPSDSGDCELAGYVVRTQQKGQRSWREAARVDAGADVVECCIGGLQMGAEYAVRVAAVNELGEGETAALERPVRVALPYSALLLSPNKERINTVLEHVLYSTVTYVTFMLRLFGIESNRIE